MKKIVFILLAAVLFLGGLAGCGGGEAEGEGATVSKPAADAQPGKPAGGGLPIDEIVGTYNVKRVDGEEEFLVNITKSGNGQLS
ncbi:MAG: hypothetical protein ACOX7P_09955 [Oscillospiraceae bacterium]